jgi:polyisoprenoid-binding protein YceI
MAWRVDRENSRIGFAIKHLRLTTVHGRFVRFAGFIHIDEENPRASLVEGSVDVASVKTGIGPRDQSLRAPSFFDVGHFPRMTFRSTSIGPFEGNRFPVTGELTIRDVTRQETFDVLDKGELPPDGGRRRWAFEARITLNRKDYGLKWNPLLELGGLLVGNEVSGLAEIQVVQE